MSQTYLSSEGPVEVDARALTEGSFRVSLGPDEVRVSCRHFVDGWMQLTLPDGRSVCACVTFQQDTAWATVDGVTFRVPMVEPGTSVEEEQGSLEAPMPGKVLSVLVAVGDTVKAGQTLVLLEAMKMEHEIRAPTDGIVESVAAVEGAMVEPGKNLVTLEA